MKIFGWSAAASQTSAAISTRLRLTLRAPPRSVLTSGQIRLTWRH
jgi:hypothetical protein